MLRYLMGLGIGLQLCKVTVMRWRVNLLLQLFIQGIVLPLFVKGLGRLHESLSLGSINIFGWRILYFEIGVIIVSCLSFWMIVEAVLSLLSEWGSLNLCITILQESLAVLFIQYIFLVSDTSLERIYYDDLSESVMKVINTIKDFVYQINHVFFIFMLS